MTDTVYKGFYNDGANWQDGDSPDLRLAVVMGSFSGSTQESAATLADFTTLDECDSSGYTRGDPASVTITYTTSTTPDEVRIDWADDADGWGATVGIPSDSILGMVVIRRVDGTNADIPWFFTDQGASDPNGGQFGWVLPATGFAFIRKAT
jgi:hypothetical protein